MKNLKAKLRKNGGFTLIEMLIVVAIIAILIAVSIPLVNNALDRARQATDAANERSAKAEVMIQYLSEKYTQGTVKYYDAVKGSLEDAAPTTGYGKSGSAPQKGGVIAVVMVDNVVYFQWITAGGTATYTGPGVPATPWTTTMTGVDEVK